MLDQLLRASRRRTNVGADPVLRAAALLGSGFDVAEASAASGAPADTVRDVLSYMQYQKRDVANAIRKQVEDAIEEERISLKESTRIKKFLEDGLEGYTYLE